MSTGIILLAAGESRRLGRPKQLLAWDGMPLVRRMALTALEAELGPVVVVLGAVDAPCREALAGLPVLVTVNPDWHSGMGGSIAKGVAALAGQDLSSVVILLCDQPFVSSSLLLRLVERASSGGFGIVASRYDHQLGPPAWFASDRFDQLLALDGGGGAKSLIRAELEPGWIDAPEAAFDIDTPEDAAALDMGPGAGRKRSAKQDGEDKPENRFHRDRLWNQISGIPYYQPKKIIELPVTPKVPGDQSRPQG